jgi:ABC-2 type transport system ATP-binding protein
LGAEGRCVVVSSHVLHEVEAMTHRVVLIRFGRLRAQGDFLRLRELIEDRPYRIGIEVDAPRARAFAAALLELAHVRTAEVNDDTTLEITTTQLDAACQEVPEVARRLGLGLIRFTSPDADLESLYRYLMHDD